LFCCSFRARNMYHIVVQHRRRVDHSNSNSSQERDGVVYNVQPASADHPGQLDWRTEPANSRKAVISHLYTAAVLFELITQQTPTKHVLQSAYRDTAAAPCV
jgi:hypothetical protein